MKANKIHFLKEKAGELISTIQQNGRKAARNWVIWVTPLFVLCLLGILIIALARGNIVPVTYTLF